MWRACALRHRPANAPSMHRLNGQYSLALHREMLPCGFTGMPSREHRASGTPVRHEAR